jgi:hypothetical protein
MRDCLRESFCSGIPFFCTNGSDDNAPNRRSGVRVYLHVHRVPTELFPKHGEFVVETLAMKRRISALPRITRETMATIE